PPNQSPSACARSPAPTRSFPNGPSTRRTRTSRSHSPRESRHVKCQESIMLQPAQIAIEEGAKVVHPVFEHRQPIDAGAEGEALPLVRIETAVGDHFWVNHP